VLAVVLEAHAVPMSSVLSTDPTAAGATPLRAGVVIEGKQGSYEMFEVRALRIDGAQLRGSLLPEVDEELTLRFGAGVTALELLARVVRVDRGAEPGIEVRFVDVDAGERLQLEALVSRSPG
jgi:hypothetical protein